MAKSDLSKLDQEFARKAAQDGLVEIEMAKLAQQKAKSDKLRGFADMMLDDHAHAKESLTEVAEKIAFKLPSELSREHRDMLDKFAAYEGADFEQQFVSTVIEEHEKDVNLYHSESEHGHNEELKRFAAEIAPVLEKHLDMAKSMYGRI